MSLDSGQGGRAAYVRLSLCLRGGKSSKSVRDGAGPQDAEGEAAPL